MVGAAAEVDRLSGEAPEAIWVPGPEVVGRSRIAAFADFVAERFPGRWAESPREDYAALHAWSVAELDEFWSAVWDFFEIVADGDPVPALADAVMPGARWFPGARLNYAEHALRSRDDADTAIIQITEPGVTEEMSWGRLRAEVGALAAWLRGSGVGVGDRVVGYLPNGRHAIVAFLASASVGAVWSVCAQDYAAVGAAARFGQLDPVVLITADGYHWNGTAHDRREEAEVLRRSLPTLRQCVYVPHLGLDLPGGESVRSWEEVTASAAPLVFERVPFDAPLWILFSSGTTGAPKGIVHGHGGVVVEHYKNLGLHLDIGPDDRFFWYTTTNWMMWNMVVSGLLVGATVVVYDGSPAKPDANRLFAIAAEHQVTVLGISPGYLMGAEKAGLEPGREVDLGSLRIIGSTGSPLPARSYGWVRDHVSAQVQLASVTGGTDVVSGFAGSAPNTPVWAGEISAPTLGVGLEAWDEAGQSVVGEVGELVVTTPMPSMPLAFWNDPAGQRYHEAYFSTFPGVWRHGDWVTVTPRGSVVISGRSDSTLNRQGVRLGSADIYQVTEKMPELAETLVIGAELGEGRYWLVLFVVLAGGVEGTGVELDDALIKRIKADIAAGASPRHVPDDVIAVPAIPHTRSGKKLEVPVKRIIQGRPLGQVAGRDAIDDYAALEHFTRFVGGPA